MPAPLVSALTYLMAPRALGMAADKAAQARSDSLMLQSKANDLTYEQIDELMRNDPYLNALGLIPRQSGLERTIDAARALYNANTAPFSPSSEPDSGLTVADLLAGRSFNDPNVQPGAYIERGGQFLTPMDDFLRYGGRDEDDLMRYLMSDEGRKLQSYGQTDQPATEVRFDQPPGGADGGLAALLRRKNAKR